MSKSCRGWFDCEYRGLGDCGIFCCVEEVHFSGRALQWERGRLDVAFSTRSFTVGSAYRFCLLGACWVVAMSDMVFLFHGGDGDMKSAAE